MKRTVLSLILASALALPGLRAQDIAQKPHIEVKGHAEQYFEPNEIYIQVTLSEKDSKGKISVSQQERKLLGIAKKLRIPARDVELMGGNSRYARYFWRKNQNQTTKTYRLKTHTTRQANRLLYELDGAAFSQARITKVDRSDREKLLKGLEIQAIKEAKARAATLLKSIGNRVGPALKVVQHRSTPPLPSLYTLNGAMPRLGNPYRGHAFDSIGFKKIKYESDIEVWFAIE